jgi:cell wall-associated NlpC family hydrolase
LLFAALLFSACATSYRLSGALETGEQAWASMRSRPPERQRLRDTIATYLGVPYLWGGESYEGIDCSGFTQAVFRKAYGLELPRKASWQSEQGILVFRFALQEGDLVFFGPSASEVDHVGIYMGDGLFANATSSEGVKYSHLDEPYWRARYLFAKRFVLVE